MAIARVQVTSGGADSSPASPIVTGNFPGSCTSGNWIIVIGRNGDGGSMSTPLDDLSTSYSLAIAGGGDIANPDMAIWYGKLTGSGTNAVSVAMTSVAYPWVYAIEVSGLSASSPLDAAVSLNQGTTPTTDAVSASFSTVEAEEYIVMGISTGGFLTYTAGADFTIVDGSIPTNPNNFGGVQERITSGTLSSYVAHMTQSNNLYNSVLATFKGDSGGGGGADHKPLTLLGVG